MVKKPTLILLGILLLLVAFTLWTQQNPAVLKGETTATATAIPKPLAGWKIDDTRMIKYEKPDSQTFTLRMGKDSTSWSLDQDSQIPVDSGKVMQMITELTSLQPIVKLETIPDESAMGLGQDSSKITLVNAGGTTAELFVGKETATSSGMYMKSGDGYYIVNTSTLTEITELLTLQGISKATETPIPAATDTAEP